MLRVVVPHLEGSIHPETQRALDRYVPFGPEGAVEFETCVWYMRLDDPVHGYGQLVKRLWDAGETFALIEQDIEIGPSTIYDFRACQHPYCAAPYPWSTAIGPALGCTRFRAEFIIAHPTVVDEAIEIGGGHFRQFDVIFQRRVLAKHYGAQPHVHAPVIHHNEAKRLRPNASPVPLEGVPVDDIGELL